MATRAAESKQSNTKQISNKQSKPVTKQQPVDVSHVSRKEKSDVDDFDYDSIIEKADSTDNPDGYKYQVAVQMANSKAGPEIDDADMRDLVDSEFAKLNPTATGAQMRGEDNVFSEVIGGFNEAKDNVSDFIGNAIDTGWDAFAGNIAGGLGTIVGGITGDENTGEDWSNFVSNIVGNDENSVFDPRVLGDIATGVAVSAIPGFGVPLSIGMSLLDNSDNIREAVTGRDSITREKLGLDDQATKLGSAALDTFLAAAPGIGKLKNATAMNSIDDILANSDDLAKGISEASTLRKSLSPSNMMNIARTNAKNVPDNAVSKISNIRDAATSSGKGRIGKTINAMITPGDEKVMRDSLMDAMAYARKTGEFANMVPGAKPKAPKGMINKIKSKIANSNAIGNFAGMGGTVIPGLANSELNYAAETNQNPIEAIGNFMPTMNDSGNTARNFISIAMPLGTAAITGAKRLPGTSGKMTYTSAPFRASQVGASGEVGSRLGQSSRYGATDADTLADWIESIGNYESEDE